MIIFQLLYCYNVVQVDFLIVVIQRSGDLVCFERMKI